MNNIFGFLRSDICVLFVRVLLHSLWQAPLLALALWLSLKFLEAASVRARYVLSLLALLSLPLIMAGTWSTLSLPEDRANEAAQVIGSNSVTVSRQPMQTSENGTWTPRPESPRPPPRWTTLAATLWLAGASLMLLRTTMSVTGAQRLRRQCKPLNDPTVLSALTDLCQRLGLRRHVRVLAGALHVPAAIGLIWPAILLPVDLLSGMPAGQVRLILAHELAHIRRHDYAVNLIQMILEALLFFNPAVYWLNRQIRREREAACDALAVAVTGEPQGYAEALADCAARLKNVALLGFHGPKDTPLRDRVLRLVSDTYHPYSRLPVWTFVGALGVSLLCLGILCAGTSWAVAEALTPQERMEKLNQAEKTHSPVRDPDSERVKVPISGVVKTEDSLLLPNNIQVHTSSNVASSSIHASLPVRDGRFSGTVSSGTVSLSILVDGYAPAVLGPRILSADDSWNDALLVLRRGYEAHVQVLDEADRPVRGAGMFASLWMEGSGVRQWATITDERGTMELKNLCPDLPLRLGILAEGFQHERIERKFEPGETLKFNLRQAAASRGLVSDRETGQPIPWAEIFVIHSNGPFQYPIQTYPYELTESSRKTVATLSNKQGRFTLASLRDDTTYCLLVCADGHAPSFLQGVRAGQDDLRVALGPPLHVEGRVLGDLDTLSQSRGHPQISYSNPYLVSPDSSVSSWRNLPLDVRDGEGHFRIDGLWEGTVRITAGTRRLNLDVTEPMDDVVIDLRPPTEGKAPATRKVVIRLLAPEGAAPTGTVRVSYNPDAPGIASYTKEVLLEKGQARLDDVPVPCNLHVRPAAIVGYWFKPGMKQCPALPDADFLWEVPVEPAGAFIGQVLNPDGQPIEDAFVTLVTTRQSTSRQPLPKPESARTGPDGRFMLTPVAYGVPYVLVAHKKGQFVTSAETSLDETSPMRETALRFPKGVNVRGHVLLPDNTPAEFVTLQLHYGTPWSHGFGTADVRTDRFGSFEIENVNPDVPGSYSIRIHPQRKYRNLTQKIKPSDQPLVLKLQRGETLKGVVVEQETGNPVPGVMVYALRQQEPFIYVDADEPTNERGEFEFTRLEAIPYRLGVRSSNEVDEVHVKGGQDASVKIQVRERK